MDLDNNRVALNMDYWAYHGDPSPHYVALRIIGWAWWNYGQQLSRGFGPVNMRLWDNQIETLQSMLSGRPGHLTKIKEYQGTSLDVPTQVEVIISEELVRATLLWVKLFLDLNNPGSPSMTYDAFIRETLGQQS